MATDPFVSPTLDDAPRQAQNVAPGVRLPAAHSWTADRPGDLHGGAGQPTGALLGSPGPNVGYAFTLAERARDRLALAPHEHAADAVAVVAEMAMCRAASYRRAPVMADVECAMLALGYQGGCAPAFAEWRARAVDGAHEQYRRRRALCDAVDLDALRLAPSALSSRTADVRERLRAAADGEKSPTAGHT
jgi:hypothetical protein